MLDRETDRSYPLHQELARPVPLAPVGQQRLPLLERRVSRRDLHGSTSFRTALCLPSSDSGGRRSGYSAACARRGNRRWGDRHVRRLPPGRTRLERHRAPRTRQTDLGHHLARRRPHGHLRLAVRDLDRDAEIHPRPVRAAGGGDRPGDRAQAGRLHRGGRRRRPAGGVPPGLRVQPLLRHRRAGDQPRRDQGTVPARTHRGPAGRFLRRRRRAGQPGRRDDGAGQGRPAARARRSSRECR